MFLFFKYENYYFDFKTNEPFLKDILENSFLDILIVTPQDQRYHSHFTYQTQKSNIVISLQLPQIDS